MRIEIPEFSLVAMVGATSSGKSSFAQKHFLPTEILSSDYFRKMISDNENDQSVTSDAFDLLYYVAEKRLNLMKTTVIDATNLQSSARRRVLDLAKEQNVHSVAIVLNLPEKILMERNAARPDRGYPARVIKKHVTDLRQSIHKLKKEGFRFVYVLNSVDEINNVDIVRTKLWSDKKDEHGPFDIIGDIHGCFDELCDLLNHLGYVPDDNGILYHPTGRKAAFLGDLCDRGPKNVAVLRMVMGMVKYGYAICVPGNHDVKLQKYLSGKNVQVHDDLAKTIEELEIESEEFKTQVREFLEGLVSHYVLDDGKLVITHAGIKEKYIGRGSGRIRDFCLYGETNGEKDEYGLPVRLDWTSDYRGKDPYLPSYFEGRSSAEAYRAYFEDTLKCLQYFPPIYDIFGHLDYVFRCGDHSITNAWKEWPDLIDEILRQIIDQGLGLDVNTGGMKNGLPMQHPHDDILRRYRELGGELITMGSDAHKTIHLGDHFPEVGEKLKAMGFKYAAAYKGRKAEFYKL